MPTLVDDQTVAIQRTGAGIVWYRGLIAFDANGTDLPAEMAVVDGDIELRVDTAGAEYPITIDPTITEDQKLVIDPDAAGDRFGESVAIDGVPGDMTIVVGAVGDDGEQGVVYVYRNDGFGWAQQAKLFAADTWRPAVRLGRRRTRRRRGGRRAGRRHERSERGRGLSSSNRPARSETGSRPRSSISATPSSAVPAARPQRARVSMAPASGSPLT